MADGAVVELDAGDGVTQAPHRLPPVVCREVPLPALHDERPLVHPMTPVRVEPVARTDADVQTKERRDTDPKVAELEDRVVDLSRGLDEVQLVVGDAELDGCSPDVREGRHLARLLQDAAAVGALLDAEVQRAVLELHRRVEPEESGQRRVLPSDPRWFRLADRTDAPGAVA